MTPADQQALDAIRAAKSSGQLRVRMGDREVTYRSMAELDRAEAAILSRYSKASGFAVSYPRMSKGIL